MGKSSKAASRSKTTKDEASTPVERKAEDSPPASRKVVDVATEHLPPIFLVFTTMACSGFLFVYAFRDVFATGRNIGGVHDEAYLTFTNSIAFFNNEKGWKSQQGGLSSISQVTTDANNMGGLFVRKVGGAACLAVQLQKLMPLLFHPANAQWKRGHFRPLFATSIVANLVLVAFYGIAIREELAAVGADGLPTMFVGVLLFETIVMLGYLATSRYTKGPAVALQQGKTPTSVVSRIVARTNFLVSGMICVIAGRDLFSPGTILGFIPRDDIYLEWTGAFLHSPPEGSPEAETQGTERDFFVGEKYLSQFLALNMLILCLYKFVAAFVVRYRNDGGGCIQARMIWKAQAVGSALVLYLFRLFSPAASTASLDFRWHLMMLAYETLILGLYGFL
ncbi:unnamed protein product [Pseudo-nitzschia multistriata]|uniref:Uncharacterized protein n=1 Tax=Pseudo-nitzschia multistriata TaxID=183589 RepID=A0A448YU84_9STRA|nr:unnamed protein product [Pseudo-nitzschia multistriata]